VSWQGKATAEEMFLAGIGKMGWGRPKGAARRKKKKKVLG